MTVGMLANSPPTHAQTGDQVVPAQERDGDTDQQPQPTPRIDTRIAPAPPDVVLSQTVSTHGHPEAEGEEKDGATNPSETFNPFTWGPITAFTCALLLLTGLQWRTSSDATQAAHKANNLGAISQLPWIAPTGDVHVGFLEESIPSVGTPVPYRIDFRNTGLTPATNVVIRSAWAISGWDAPMPDKLPDDTPTHTVGAIGPGVTHRQFFTAPTPLDSAARRAVFEIGSGRMTIYGIVEFSDILNPQNRRFTQFCLLRVGPAGPWSVSGPYNNYSN